MNLSGLICRVAPLEVNGELAVKASMVTRRQDFFMLAKFSIFARCFFRLSGLCEQPGGFFMSAII